MATLYKANGEKKQVSPKRKRFSLDELQAAVGGYVEYIHLGNDKVLVVNEDGLLLNLPINENASKITAQFGYVPIVGDALVADRNQIY